MTLRLEPLPDLPADCNNDTDMEPLPELPELPANGSNDHGVDPQPELPADGACHEKCQKCRLRGRWWQHRSCLRHEARADIPTITAMFGQDLFEIPKAWLDPVCAHQLIVAACGTKSMALAPWFLFEVFGGCGHLSLASKRASLYTGPSVDILYQR